MGVQEEGRGVEEEFVYNQKIESNPIGPKAESLNLQIHGRHCPSPSGLCVRHSIAVNVGQ